MEIFIRGFSNKLSRKAVRTFMQRKGKYGTRPALRERIKKTVKRLRGFAANTII
jgi:hypothetical protein